MRGTTIQDPLRRNVAVLVLAVAALAACLAGCGPSDATDAARADAVAPTSARSAERRDGPLRIVCTVGMVADIARNVGGSHVQVTALMGEGVDPHLYKASPGDVRLLSAADLIAYNGLNLEGRMTDVLIKLARKIPIIAVSEGIGPALLREPPEFRGHYDPHVWFDVSMWARCAAHLRDRLIEFDPAHREDYQANAKRYLAALAELHEYTRRRIATIDRDRRVLVTAHDAFGYFGRAYDIDVRAIQGLSTESEASVRDINELVQFIVDRKVKAVFVETSVSEKNINALVEGCAAVGHRITIGGSLFSDAMGADGTPEGTYVGMVRHNVDTIVAALR